MYAIIETGGKQFKVAKDDVLNVELLNADVDLKVGNPTVEGAKVTAKVLEHGKAKKIVVFHYKPKKNIRKKNGHRQPFTKLQIVEINAQLKLTLN